MKWYQHQTNSRNDTKVKGLIQKYGMEGYGLYHLVNEIIAEKVEENLNCILEPTADLLAIEANISPERVTEILDHCVRLGLLTLFDLNKYQNLKVVKYCDNWAKRKKTTELLQSDYVVTTETLQRPSVQNRIEYKRLDQNKLKEIKTDKSKYDKFNVKVNLDSNITPKAIDNRPMPLIILQKEEDDLRATLQKPNIGSDLEALIKSQLNLNLKKQKPFFNKDFKSLGDMLT